MAILLTTLGCGSRTTAVIQRRNRSLCRPYDEWVTLRDVVSGEWPHVVRFLQYELVRQLGVGGSAQVWAARTDDGLDVAVKLFFEQRREDTLEVLRGEATRMARLDHRRILGLRDAGVLPHALLEFEAGSPFLVMELIDGPTLDQVAAPAWPWVQSVTLQLLDALAAAHARNIVHLDVKPSNVLLRHVDPPDVVLADFGIAFQPPYSADAGEAVRPFIGTPRYMAPEQVRSQVADFGPWTDLYALAAMVFEMCTGAPPFTGPTVEVLRQHLEEPIARLVPQFRVPRDIEDWLWRCLAKSKHDRFSRAAEAAWALLEVCAEFTSDAPAPVAPDDVVISGALTMTWDGADLDTLVQHIPPRTLPSARTARPLRRFGSPVLPRRFTRDNDFFRGARAPLSPYAATLDAIWADVHRAYSENVPRALVLHGGDPDLRALLLYELLVRVFEFGVGLHLRVRADDPRSTTDRAATQLFNVDHFDSPDEAVAFCTSLLDTIDDSTALPAEDRREMARWVRELAQGNVTMPLPERRAVLVNVLSALPRSPIIMIDRDDDEALDLLTAMLDMRPYASHGAFLILNVDAPTRATAAFVDRRDVTTMALA